jgi:hypothetical protein
MYILFVDNKQFTSRLFLVFHFMLMNNQASADKKSMNFNSITLIVNTKSVYSIRQIGEIFPVIK